MRRALLAASLALVPTAAFAHVGVGDANGFAHGFMHPVSGMDHVLAMVAVGVFAAQLGGRAVWAAPCAFVGMMIVGGALGMSGVNVPFVEIGIGLSVVVLGSAVALGLSVPVIVAMALVGFFAVFHGHAHGAEMPETSSGLSYGAGFVIATAMLHIGGIGLGLGAGRSVRGRRIAQVAGGSMTIAGVAILSGVL
jgi:urease accessory protein